MNRFWRGWDRFHLVMAMIALAIVLIGCGESRRGPSTAQQKAPAKRQYGLPPHIPPAPVNISPLVPGGAPLQAVTPEVELFTSLESQA